MASTEKIPDLNPAVVNWTLYDDRSGRIHPHEPLERYTPGGFHPVALGDALKDSRYVIRHKLGYGGFSTVWLASDEQGQGAVRRYVAIKIKSSSTSEMGIDADPEVLRLEKLEACYLTGPQDRSRPYVQLLDCFSVDGPNGRHNCLVTELLGPSLASVHSLYGQLEQVLRPETILRASKQLLQGIDFIHQAGFVHGDISATNVTFTCKSLLNYEDDLLDLVSEVYAAKPWPDKPLPSPHLPKQLVQAAVWSTWEDETEEDIRLVDWGSAFPIGETVPVEALAQPIDFRSPETFFIGELDHRHDIWRAGCVIYVLFYQRPPFFVFLPDSYFYMLRMIEKLGPLPESWLHSLAELRKESIYAEREDGRADPDSRESELICDTFKPRRQAIIAEFTSGDEKYDEPDEHTESDFEALNSLQPPILALLRYEPDNRATVKDAMGMIEWVDHRRGEEGGNDQNEDEDENGKGEQGEDIVVHNLNQLTLDEYRHK